MILKRLIFGTIITSITFVSGCAKSLNIDIMTDELPQNVNTIILMNNNGFTSAIRKSLLKNGFNVKAQPTVITVTEKHETYNETYNRSEARYGIRHSGTLSWNNPCFTNGKASHFSEYEYELIDVNTNDSILTISKGGWTEWCSGAPTVDTTDLFGDLAKELARVIKPRKVVNSEE